MFLGHGTGSDESGSRGARRGFQERKWGCRGRDRILSCRFRSNLAEGDGGNRKPWIEGQTSRAGRSELRVERSKIESGSGCGKARKLEGGRGSKTRRGVRGRVQRERKRVELRQEGWNWEGFERAKRARDVLGLYRQVCEAHENRRCQSLEESAFWGRGQ